MSKSKKFHVECQFGESFERACRAALIAALIETSLTAKKGK